MSESQTFSASATHYLTLAYEDSGSASYDKWAETYDIDVNTMSYAGHKSVCSKWQSYHTSLGSSSADTVPTIKHKVFDAGCGTGLVGECLTNLVPHDLMEIHGGDLSLKMLEIAKSKNVYADLQIVNIEEQLPYEAEYFDSVLCAGVFGRGHCAGPKCIPNLLYVLKPGGYLFATANREVYNTETKLEWQKRIEECNCVISEDNEMPYRDGAKAVVIVIHKPQKIID